MTDNKVSGLVSKVVLFHPVCATITFFNALAKQIVGDDRALESGRWYSRLVDLAPVLERYVVESTYNQIDRQLSTIPVYTRAFLKMRDTDTKGCHLTGIVPLERNSTTVKAALDEVVEVLCEYRRQPVIELTGRDRFVGCGIVNASEASQCSGLACGEANMSAHTMARNRNLLSRLTTRRT